jgi:hypothetical protein
MKTTHYLLIVATAGLLAMAGCGKSKTPPPPPGTMVYDVTKLFEAFPAPSPETKMSLDKIRFAVRYRQYDVAVAELDKLTQIPDLTEDQKKAIADKTEQVKKAMTAAAPRPPQ